MKVEVLNKYIQEIIMAALNIRSMKFPSGHGITEGVSSQKNTSNLILLIVKGSFDKCLQIFVKVDLLLKLVKKFSLKMFTNISH